MSKKPSQPRKLRDLTSILPEDEALEAAWKEIHHGSDAAVALLTTAWIDRHLETCLTLRMVDQPEKELQKLFGNSAPLSSTQAKTHLCYALGILGIVTKKAITTIISIRNTFSHSVISISFETFEISMECNKLENIPDEYRAAKHLQMDDVLDQERTSRSRFSDCALAIIVALLIDQNRQYKSQTLSLKEEASISHYNGVLGALKPREPFPFIP